MTDKEFGDLYVRYFALTCNFLRSRRIVEEDRVEECVQEAWLRGFENKEKLRNPLEIDAWINSISLNYAKDLLRRDHHLTEFAPIEDGEKIAVNHSEETLNKKIDCDRILKRVCAEDRYVLWLLHCEGYSGKEIGEKFGIESSSARVRAFRARILIRKKSARMDAH